MSTLVSLHLALTRALHARDPLAVLQTEREQLTGSAQSAVDFILNHPRERDGFVISSLLVKKLRFELVYRGDNRLARWFDRDPAAFAAAFQEYQQSVVARECFARPAAAAFLQFLESRGLAGPALSSENETG